MSDRKRIIFHLDMDHFYTAVEEREQPALKGKPVIVGADPKEGKGRGVVHTCNYEARRLGVRSGMPISRAWRTCPEAVYLPPNFALYIRVSNEIMNIARKYGYKFERWGIDEAFLDVTSKVRDFAEAEVVAKKLKEEIYEKEKLTCSIGIGSNKLVAKVASDHEKPNGLTVVKEEETKAFLAPLPVRKLLWVGRKTEQRLSVMGIKTISDLAHYEPVSSGRKLWSRRSPALLDGERNRQERSSREERSKIHKPRSNVRRRHVGPAACLDNIEQAFGGSAWRHVKPESLLQDCLNKSTVRGFRNPHPQQDTASDVKPAT